MKRFSRITVIGCDKTGVVTREPLSPETLLNAVKAGQLKCAEPAVVLANRRDLEPLACKHKLPFVRVPWKDRRQAKAATLSVLED